MASANSPPRLQLHNAKKKRCGSRNTKSARYYSPDYASFGLSSPWRTQQTQLNSRGVMSSRKVYPRGYFEQLPLPNDYLDYEPGYYNACSAYGLDLPSPHQYSNYTWKAAQTDRITTQGQDPNLNTYDKYKEPYTNQTERQQYWQYNREMSNMNQIVNELKQAYNNLSQDYHNFKNQTHKKHQYQYQDRYSSGYHGRSTGNRLGLHQQKQEYQQIKYDTNRNNQRDDTNQNDLNKMSHDYHNNNSNNNNNNNSNNNGNNINNSNPAAVIPSINANQNKLGPSPTAPIVVQQPSHQFSSSFIYKADPISELSNISQKRQQQQQGHKKTFSQAILDQLMRDNEHKKYQSKYNSDNKYSQVIMGKMQKTVYNNQNSELVMLREQAERKRREQQQIMQTVLQDGQDINQIKQTVIRNKPKLQITTLPTITQQPQPSSPRMVGPSKHLSTQPTLSLAVSRSLQNIGNLSPTSPTVTIPKGYNLRSSTAQTVDQSLLYRQQANTQTQDNSQSQLIIFQKLVQNVMDDRDFRIRINNKMDEFSRIKVEFEDIQPVQLNGLVETKEMYVKQSEEFLSRMNRIIGDADIQRRTRQASFDARSRAQSNTSNVSFSMQPHTPHPMLIKQTVPSGQGMTHVRSQPSFSFPNSQQSISTIKPQTAKYITGASNAMPQIQVHSPTNHHPLLTPPAMPASSTFMPNSHQNMVRPVQFGNHIALLTPPSPIQVVQQVSYQRISPPRSQNNSKN